MTKHIDKLLDDYYSRRKTKLSAEEIKTIKIKTLRDDLGNLIYTQNISSLNERIEGVEQFLKIVCDELDILNEFKNAELTPLKALPNSFKTLLMTKNNFSSMEDFHLWFQKEILAYTFGPYQFLTKILHHH